VAKDLLAVVKTKKTELLFLALFIPTADTRRTGRAGHCAGWVLFGSSTGHTRERCGGFWVEDQKLDAVISLPAPGVFRPYAGVSTAILTFTKTNSGGHRLRVVLCVLFYA